MTPPDMSTADGLPKIRVNVRHDLHGVVAVTGAQLMEEIKEEAKEGEAKEGAEDPPKKKRFRKVSLLKYLSVVNSQTRSITVIHKIRVIFFVCR